MKRPRPKYIHTTQRENLRMASTYEMIRTLFLVFVFSGQVDECRANYRGDPTPQFAYEAEDDSLANHFAFGEAVGSVFASKIRARFSSNSNLQDMLKYTNSTAEGSLVYDEFYAAHDEAFPLYMEEIRGIAVGAGLPFKHVFVMNLILEFSSVAALNPSNSYERSSVDGCSDYMLCNAKTCVLGHNEDNDATSLNHTIMISASFGPGKNFTGFTYAGDLTTGAFGFNNNGVGFSLNWVGPIDVVRGGLGRGFISRSMMDSQDFDDAIRRATRDNQCSGHNLNIMDFSGKRRIYNVETAPGHTYGMQTIEAVPFFHANQYELLKRKETFGNSSTHRIARVAELPPPTNAKDILHILGDQEDILYPIFHDTRSHDRGELSDWTMATALFDVDRRLMTMYHGNPRDGSVMYTYNVNPVPV